MKFTLVTGPAAIIECVVCKASVIGGTEPYASAATGKPVQPSEVYSEEAGGLYCSECAAKLSVEDPTRAVHQFYTDTTGKEIDHARLLDEA